MNQRDALLLSDARVLCRSARARQLRENGRLTLREVASVVECSPSTILRWERGQRTPTGKPGLRYAKLMVALSVGEHDGVEDE